MSHGPRLLAVSIGVGGLLFAGGGAICQEATTTGLPGKRWAELETLRFNPKMSPDTASDYRPAIAKRLSRIPEVALETLPELVRLLLRLNKAAARSPGAWVSGFAYLGANPKEYRPSDDELVAAEVGDRIYRFVSKASLGEVVAVLQKARLDVASVSYARFQFRHADVMGTGRYFYSSAPRQVTISLRDPATTTTSVSADPRQ